MKKLLWTSAMALATMACLTACDETSSSSYEIPSYNSDTSLPDICSMEVAKVDTAYFACFENKWVEVTDSATVEQLKEGLDEEEIKAKLEELETLLVKPANTTPKPTSSSAQSEVEGSDDEEDSSSSSEEEEEYSSSSKKKKNKDKDEDDSGSGSGEVTEKKCGDVTYDPKTQVCGDDDKILSKCGKNGYDPETQVCGDDDKILSKCGESGYDPETQVCGDGDKVLSKCGESGYDSEDQFCYDSYIFGKCGTKSYDVKKEYCDAGAVKELVVTKSADIVEVGETVVVDINKIVGSTSVTGSDGALTYAGWVSGTNGDGGLKITVTNKEAFTTGSKTITLNIRQSLNNKYEFVIPVELDVAPKYSTCGTKQYYPKTHFCDSRVGNNIIYKKVTLGKKVWMAENLRYASSTGSYCYGGTASNCTTYGRLYTWPAAVGMASTCNTTSTCDLGSGNIQGVCPAGWHIPNDDEMKELKDRSDLFDADGFNAQKAGYYDGTNYNSINTYAGFWGREQNASGGYRLMMESSSNTYSTNPKKYGNPVRCVKD